MDWTNKNVNPNKVVHVGQETEVMILDVDVERRRISLGMKQCQTNPWDDFSNNHDKGDLVKGQIKSITDFGIFVGLAGGIDGLVHLSDVSWSSPGEEAVRDYKKGDEIEAIVLAVDPERERISLGVKQMDTDPFSTYMSEHPRGSIVTGTITEVDARQATVNLAEGIDGVIRASEISRDRVDDASTVLKVGEQVEAKFTGVDRKTRMLSLSIKAKDYAEEAEVMEEYSNQSSSSTPMQAMLQSLKSKITDGGEEE